MRFGTCRISALAFLVFFCVTAPLAAQDLSSFERRQDGLSLTGNGAPANIARYVARKIAEVNPQINFRISEGNSQTALEQLEAGLIQIAGLNRALTDEERDLGGLVSFPLAREGAAVVVNRENPVSGLSQSQLRDVFGGRVSNWRQLGGRSTPIKLYVLPPAHPARVIMDEIVLDGEPMASSARVMGASPNIKDALGEDPDGIGFINISNLDILVKGLNYEGVSPSLDNSAYKISRTVYLVTKGPPQGLAKDFINFLRSPDGATFIREAGYSPVDR